MSTAVHVVDALPEDKSEDSAHFLDGPAELYASYLQLSEPLKSSETIWFIRQGVSIGDLDHPVCVRAGAVVWGRHCFRFASEMDSPDVTPERACILGVIGIGGLRDLVAWRPSTGRLQVWLGGSTFALGEAQIWHQNIFSDPLPIHRTPLSWLRNHRRGLVIVNPKHAPFHLCDVTTIVAEDAEHRRELQAMFRCVWPSITVAHDAPAIKDCVVK